MPESSLEKPPRRPSIGRRHSALAVPSSVQQMLQPISEPASPEASGANGDAHAEGDAAPHAKKRARLVRSRSARSSGGLFVGRNTRVAVAVGEGNAVTHASKAVPSPEPTRYEEMMVRFQVRQMQRSPSVATDISDSKRLSVEASSVVGGGEQVAMAMASDRSAASPPKALYRHMLSSRRSSQSSLNENPEARYRINSDRPRGLGPSDRASTSTVGYGHPGVDGSVDPARAGWGGFVGKLVNYTASAVMTPISPFSTLCQVRYTLLLGVTVVYLLYFPLELAFSTSRTSKAISIALSAFFGVDALLELDTAIVSKSGALVTSRAQIVVHYMKNRFLVDIISSLPLDLILEDRIGSDDGDAAASSPSWAYVTYAFRLERLVLVVRLVRLVWQLRVNESANTIWTWALYSRYSHLLRIGWIIVLVLVIAHYMACIWAMLALSSASEISSWAENYAYSFYTALQLLQGQGIPTDSVAEDIFASFSILLGSLVLATVFGHVAILVANFNAAMTNYQRKMEGVFAVMTKMRLPPLLRERIHVYYEHLWNEYECLDGEIVQFTKELSHSLELEVVLFKYMEVVMHIPFFRECTPDFQKQLLLNLQVRVYLPDDFIMREGEVGDELFIINRGFCELVGAPDSFERVTGRSLGAAANERQRRVTRRRSSSAISIGHDRDVRSTFELDLEQMERVNLTLNNLQQNADPARQQAIISRGQAFGDLALLMNYQCTANVRAITHVEMCVLNRKSFHTVLTRYPDDRKLVVLDMLTSYMDTCEKSKLPCPLLDAVRSVFVPCVVESLSVAEAADRVYRAIDADLRDTSIKYGIDDSTRARLERLRDQRREEAKDKAKAKAKAVEPKQSPVRRVSTSDSTEGRHGKPTAPQPPHQQQINADGTVSATEREMVAARLKQIEERERTIQAALKQLDASLAKMRAERAAELLQARGMDCASCAKRARRQTASVSTQTQAADASPAKLRRTPTSLLAKKPRWSRVKSQPQLNINVNELVAGQDQDQADSSPPLTHASKTSEPAWHITRQRSHSVVVSSSNDPGTARGSGDAAFRTPNAPSAVQLLQRMGTFVRLGSAPAASTESPTRFADELFKPKKTKEASDDDSDTVVPPQGMHGGGAYRLRRMSHVESSAAAALDVSESDAAAVDPVANRRQHFQRKHSQSLGSLASADGSRTPALFKAMGSIVGLLDGAKAAAKADESPTRYADELFHHTAAHPPQRGSVGASDSPLASVLESGGPARTPRRGSHRQSTAR